MAMAIHDDGPISFEIDSASASNKNLIGCQHQLRQELWLQLKHIPGHFGRNLKSDFHRMTSNSCKSAMIQPLSLHLDEQSQLCPYNFSTPLSAQYELELKITSFMKSLFNS